MKVHIFKTTLLASLLTLLCITPVMASAFSDGSQENFSTEAASEVPPPLFSSAEQEDYAISIPGNEIILTRDLWYTDPHELSFPVYNVGKKTITFAIPDSRYLTFYSDTAQPGEYGTIEVNLRNTLPIGEYHEIILITDTTGNLNVCVPVTIKVVGDGLFHADKQELDFGVMYEGRALPPPQSFKVIIDSYPDSGAFYDFWGGLNWRSGNLYNNFSADYDKTTQTITVSPKPSIKPGVYEGDLGIGYICEPDECGHTAHVRIKLTVLPNAPKIIKTTVKQNQVDIYLDNIDGTFYECYLSQNAYLPPSKYTSKKATYQTANHITFTNVPKGTHYVLVRRVIPGLTNNCYSPLAPIKTVKVSVSTPSRPKITSAKVSKQNLILSVSRSQSTIGYQVALSKYMRPDDCSEGSSKKPYFTAYSLSNQTAKSVTMKNIKPGTYYLSVRAYNKQSGQTVYSCWSAPKKITVK